MTDRVSAAARGTLAVTACLLAASCAAPAPQAGSSSEQTPTTTSTASAASSPRGATASSPAPSESGPPSAAERTYAALELTLDGEPVALDGQPPIRIPEAAQRFVLVAPPCQTHLDVEVVTPDRWELRPSNAQPAIACPPTGPDHARRDEALAELFPRPDAASGATTVSVRPGTAQSGARTLTLHGGRATLTLTE